MSTRAPQFPVAEGGVSLGNSPRREVRALDQ